REQAKDAAEALEIEYEVVPAAVSAIDAVKPGAPQVHAEAPDNIAFDWEVGDKAATDEAFSKADHVTRLDLINNRMVTSAIEPRAAVAEYDSGADSITLYVNSQNPHAARLVLSAFVQVAPEHKLRVVSPDVGGGFGSKISIYPEETTIAWASKQIGRPIKWTAERTESFLSDTQGRDHVTHAELALDKDGKFLGLRVNTTANLGAYLALFGVVTPTYLHGIMFAGQYTTPAIHCEVKGVYTHTAPVDASRGAGRPEATYVVERVVDRAARETGIDPVEIRRRNFIPPDAFPYQTPVIHLYDSGNYGEHMDKALEMANYGAFEARRAEAKSRGKLRGIGISSYIEACGVAPSAAVGSLGCAVGLWEAAHIRFNPTGSVVLFTGQHSHGQGHETTFAQIAADKLGVPIENIEVVHGDTAQVLFGMGTYGSRSVTVGGMAIAAAADKLIAKGAKIAAHLMEASEADVEFTDGNFTVAGTDKSVNIGQVAFTAYVPHNYPAGVEPGFEETAFYDP
ncbi:MAG: xanthine dehydrogenase family protein molybdopterin-binding subunit, partial [Kiloniellaceae bacterium]